MSSRLDADIASHSYDNRFTRLFVGESDVAAAISQLNKATNIDALRQSAAFGQPQEERLMQVDRQILELTTKSPAETIKALINVKSDIEDVQLNVSKLKGEVGAHACEQYQVELNQLKAALTIRASLDVELSGHMELNQTGSPTWIAFIESARRLGHSVNPLYPSTGDPCLLCHRPLDEPSVSLIQRFWGFLDHDARRSAEAANKRVSEFIEKLQEVVVDLLPQDGRRRADMAKFSLDAVIAFDEITKLLKARRANILNALISGSPDRVPSTEIEIDDTVVAKVIGKIDETIAQLSDGNVEAVIRALREEHIHLRHKQVLNQNIDDVVTYVEDMRWVDIAARQKRSTLTTRFITDKQRELFRILIEGRYKERLQAECNALDCVLPFEFRAHGSGGRTVHALALQSGHKPHEIFSEGEQRVVALADFLTEVSLNPAGAAIVLDDPVTSMDHIHKRQIAKRLAEEARIRQVIIFTHDIVFLSLLMESADKLSVNSRAHWVQKIDNIPGVVALDDAPNLSKAYASTEIAEKHLTRARNASGQERVTFVRTCAGALRRTLEEVIVNNLLKGAVKRWDEQIRIGALSKITWNQETVDEIVTLQDDISRIIEGHSNSEVFADTMPEPDVLKKLIDRVNAVRSKVKVDRKSA